MTALPIEQLEHMTPAEERQFWKVFERVLSNDDGQAAQSHLSAGRPIYYCDDRYPDDFIREWPDGRRELISVDDTGKISVIRSL
ncbi:conserved hypothetical protein [Candidatus Glomeribacter gigasporarum BEG34]|uniref:Uncharacterized protein n=1 Tax=Candidatus Glomeribacter gigasporarum BEG34 TaxID=1070319 RepID=G2J9A8_9BURK|nr:hypothetical protein [Candidatus Glomeribacter gigasporarum]CCD29355.1 conserved hypothetical protein [Candidatus Glomeribacter gigasporarum BEG34]